MADLEGAKRLVMSYKGPKISHYGGVRNAYTRNLQAGYTQITLPLYGTGLRSRLSRMRNSRSFY